MRNTVSGRARVATALLLAIACMPAAASAAVINRGTEGTPLSEIRPAPQSIYPDQRVITAEPAPSDVNQAYLGPVLLMKSAIVDLEAGTATLPLRKGKLASGETVWSVLTDATDENLARLNGVPYSSKLAYATMGKVASGMIGTEESDFGFRSLLEYATIPYAHRDQI